MIARKPPFLIKNLLILWLALTLKACFAQADRTVVLLTPDGAKLNTRLALTLEEQSQGLSGLSPEQFGDNEAMLFYYLEDGIRQFWMPDTHFNLDIFFLDHELRVIDVDRNMMAHPGLQEPPPIARTRAVRAHHVLELKSSSPHARGLKIGHQLKWMGPPARSEIESSIRHGR